MTECPPSATLNPPTPQKMETYAANPELYCHGLHTNALESIHRQMTAYCPKDRDCKVTYVRA